MFRDDLVVIDSILMKGRYIIAPAELQKQELEKLHSNHMGIENSKPVGFELSSNMHMFFTFGKHIYS